MGGRYIFFTVLISVFVLLHYLFDKRVVKKLEIPKNFRVVLRFLVYTDLVLLLGYIFGRYYMDIPAFLYYLLSLSVGISLLLFLAYLFYEVVTLFERFIPSLREKKRYIDAVFLIFVGIYIYIGIFSGTTKPKLLHVKVDEGVLSKSVKIAQISDIHIGNLIDKNFVADIVKKINSQNVDLVAITGDLVDTKPEKSKEALKELKKLRSRYGIFYIVGNHEYFRGAKKIIDYLKNEGITVLENSNKRIGDFYIAGVYDTKRRRRGVVKMDMNITEAYSGIPKDAPVLLLMHRPSAIERLGDYRPSLILSGHTHGGQIWPFGYIVELYEPYLKGLHKLGEKSYIYVNSGAGFWGPAMRVGTQSEIALIEWK